MRRHVLCLFWLKKHLFSERELEAAAQGQQLSADFYASMLLLMLVEGEARLFFFFSVR